jgi:phosphate transport system permease protein
MPPLHRETLLTQNQTEPTSVPSLTSHKRGLSGTQSDALFRNTSLIVACIALVAIVGIGILLFLASRSNIAHTGLGFFAGTQWDPIAPDADKKSGNLFGVLPFVYGTLVTSGIALLIAVPLGIGTAIFLSELAPKWLSTPISFIVELLAAVPSIVYGFWALNYLLPALQSHVESWFTRNFGQIPFFTATQDAGVGQNFFAAGIILSMMVLPFITAVSRDVLKNVPLPQREAAMGMGATRWEAIRTVVLRHASSGIIGAVMLGLGRAIGETMAVTMVIGSKITLPQMGDPSTFSLFRPGYTMTALLADQYPSPNSDLHSAALTQVALTLFVVTVLVNGMARGMVWLTSAKASSNPWSLKIKEGIAVGGKIALLVLIVLAFSYQTYSDIRLKGVLGLFGVAQLIGIFALCLFLFNRAIPGKPLFLRWRHLSSRFALGISGACAFVACLSLFLLLFFVGKEGIGSINGTFFQMPEAGGVRHALAGTGMIVLFASLIGIPVGVLGGIYLAEFGDSKFGGFVRFATDLLNGVPSIVIGIFSFTLLIVPTQGKIGIANAGAFGLGIMMIPTVMRTTEEIIRLVPIALREGSLALGATYTRTVWQVVLPSARGGIVTGVLLAVARVAGETAPLLMVGCNSSLWNLDMKKPIASLPMQIYVLRDQIGSDAYKQLWGVAFLLVLLVLFFSILSRYVTRNRWSKTA